LDEKKNEVWLTLAYDLGPQYRFLKLNVKGLDLEGEPAIRKIYKPKPGDPFDPDYPEAFLRQVRDARMFDFLGKTRADVKLDDEKHTAEVTLDFKGEEIPDKKKRPF
jgi:outer membrane translocation and assembly module TamA